MAVTWRDLAFRLEPDAARDAARAWSWLLPEPWEPIICSMVGGIFLEASNGTVVWLDTGTGLVEQVAESREQFEETCRSSYDVVEEWFLPPLVERLLRAGKKPNEGECYGFVILPIFAEGKYDTENMFVVPVSEQFVGMAAIHRQLSEVPERASVQLRLTD